MQNSQATLSNVITSAMLTAVMASPVAGEETIVQQETLSFEKCLEVITTSENRLSVAPEITDISDQKRVAVYTLGDGTLTITCDGEQNIVVVSTNTD